MVSGHSSEKNIGLLQLAFRPLFMMAALFAVLAMLIWLLAYSYHINLLPKLRYSLAMWHAHEMIYGYGLAVITGFLLTAIRNWTGLPTTKEYPLLGLALLWLVARIFVALGSDVSLLWTAIADNGFILLLIVAAMGPIIRAKQWRQIGIISKLWLLLASNIVFYLGVFGIIQSGERLGIYSGLILILGLILTILRRVYPFFFKRALSKTITSHPRMEKISLAGFFVFWLSYTINPASQSAMLAAAVILSVNTMCLAGYYSHDIWKHSLLWSIFISYASIIVGFACVVAGYFTSLSPFIALHAFAVGGLGLMTLALMARVSLGHTGRDVYQPPKTVKIILTLLCLCLLFRVGIPLFTLNHYPLWILISQLLWIGSFSLFFFVYFPIWLYRRVDGKDG